MWKRYRNLDENLFVEELETKSRSKHFRLIELLLFLIRRSFFYVRIMVSLFKMNN